MFQVDCDLLFISSKPLYGLSDFVADLINIRSNRIGGEIAAVDNRWVKVQYHGERVLSERQASRKSGVSCFCGGMVITGDPNFSKNSVPGL
jgi:hypothetical protein